VVAAGCLALAVVSLAFPAAPTFDPWAWVVFGREVVVPSLGLSTVAFTGWKPLPVLFTAPLALFGAAAPSLWLVVARTAGLAAMVLAFRLAARVGGRVAGAIAAVALLACDNWLRFLSAGNVEPLVVALLLGAIELHLRGRRAAAFLLAALVGLARPEVWPLLGAYAVYLARSDRRWWPLAVGIPGMLALWIVPDWIGSGDPLRTFHSAEVSSEPHALQRTGTPWLGLVRGAVAIAPAPVWIGTLSALALWWRNRDRTVAALALVAAAWTLPTVIGTALGYPAVPRYLFEPVAICCVLAGIGLVALVRLARDPRARTALAVTLAVISAPFVVTRATGLGRQAAWAEGWADQASALWRAVDRAERHAPVARLHPVVEPRAMANGLAWKLGVRLDDVAGSFTPGTRIAFLAGNVRAVIARLHRRNATARPLTRAGPWHVVLVHWSPNDRGPPTGAKELASPARAPRDAAQRPARPPPAAPPRPRRLHARSAARTPPVIARNRTDARLGPGLEHAGRRD
jgi:hypothetical protein